MTTTNRQRLQQLISVVDHEDHLRLNILVDILRMQAGEPATEFKRLARARSVELQAAP